ncbi:sodium/glutamate symporter [Pseudomaricurvus alkylphenolicus]|uniref:sodium/glutamate symporter n=1 Tax=Pseudomaricurvus alkylphenolicus TaxID=1306991 RepID=UPI001423AAA9|nr:sodium/glutamate symporter [Pseudomaricurvus alkylphenolicus]NIB39149.1 sodium/glutamate symporter [Pseudomaricurvus alkylphenolicus]
MNIDIGFFETLVAALLILFSGYLINGKVTFLKNNNIPEPVVGGIAFSLVSALLYGQLGLTINFDMSMKTPLMILFFTSVGLGASLKLLVKGGPKVLLFLGVASLYLVVQNAVGVSLALATDLHPMFGLFAGSVTLSGGHGTGATYAQLIQDSHNLQGVLEVAMAAATFGLVLGGLLGGPVARRLISRHQLQPSERPTRHHDMITYDPEDRDLVTPKRMMETLLILAFCMGSGSYVFEWLKAHSVPVPSFIVPLIIGIIITNVLELSGTYRISKACVDLWGTMALSIFLALALMSLRIWELLNLAGPMLFIILTQTLVLAGFAYFVTFRLMGKNYDAAIMAGGHCGFGLGATPTAVANMESLVSRFGPSPQAFLVVPMVGAFFIDITNAIVIQSYLALPLIK